MSINLNNYEAYLIDYLDGNLSIEIKRELMLFLENNPGIKTEFKELENFKLEGEELIFKNKKSLLRNEIISTKSINEDNYEEYFIAFYENDLSVDEKQQIDEFVQKNPQLAKEFELHKSLILYPGKIEFKHKDKLKKKLRIALWQYQSLAVAASIALLISYFWLLNPSNENRLDYSHISFAQRKDISLPHEANTNIRVRNTITESVIQTVESSEYGNTDDTRLEKPLIIQSLKMRNTTLVLVGEIECTKLRYPKNNGNSVQDFTRQKNNKLLAKVIRSNTSKFTKSLKTTKGNDQIKKKDPALIKILQGSISFFNTITGSEVEQLKVYNSEGSLEKYQLETETFAINKKFKPKGAE
jgi:hypothetical protein